VRFLVPPAPDPAQTHPLGELARVRVLGEGGSGIALEVLHPARVATANERDQLAVAAVPSALDVEARRAMSTPAQSRPASAADRDVRPPPTVARRRRRGAILARLADTIAGEKRDVAATPGAGPMPGPPEALADAAGTRGLSP